MSTSFWLVLKRELRVSRQESQLWAERLWPWCSASWVWWEAFMWTGKVPSQYVVRFSTRLEWLSSFLAWHDLVLLQVSLLGFQKELSVCFALVLCFYWFFGKTSPFWIFWILLNSFSVLCDKGLCQERYKGSLWCVGNPFLLVRQCNAYFSFTCGLYFPSALLVLQ